MNFIKKVPKFYNTIAHYALGFGTTILKVTNFPISNRLVNIMKAQNKLMHFQSLQDKMNYLDLLKGLLPEVR